VLPSFLEVILIIPTSVFLLSVVGLADALYFTFAYYGRVRKFRWVPEVLCARESSSCVTVVKTPYARVFGVPNSLLGVLYYVLLMAWSGTYSPGTGWPVGFEMEIGGQHRIFRIGWLVVAASAETVLLGFYLVYALRRKLGVDCVLCYAAHAINVALFVLLLLGFHR
jgi:uncharacterized membrane protein